jgi:hypothetical protein
MWLESAVADENLTTFELDSFILEILNVISSKNFSNKTRICQSGLYSFVERLLSCANQQIGIKNLTNNL